MSLDGAMSELLISVSFPQGAMQDVRLIVGVHGYLSVCPSLDTSCPTCGQFTLLQSTVQELSRLLQELSERVYGLPCNVNYAFCTLFLIET